MKNGTDQIVRAQSCQSRHFSHTQSMKVDRSAEEKTIYLVSVDSVYV